MNRRVLQLYNEIMSVPVGLPHREHRKMVRRYVTGMSASEREDILGRADEIEDSSVETFMARKQVLLELGFTEGEASIFARCRLHSPGLHTIIKERVRVTRHATDAEIERINAGCRGTLLGLERLYGKGGLYGETKG